MNLRACTKWFHACAPFFQQEQVTSVYTCSGLLVLLEGFSGAGSRGNSTDTAPAERWPYCEGLARISCTWSIRSMQLLLQIKIQSGLHLDTA